MTASSLLKNLSLAAAGAAILALSISQTSQAATFVESGDAGQTLGTAQQVGAGVNVIQGSTNLGSGDYADLFSFNWGGGAFSATTIGGASFDTMLQLFNSSGTLLLQNDDSQGTLQSTISSSSLITGQYLLGLSSYPNFASDGPSYGTIRGNGGSSGSYSITLNQQTTSVPEPTSTLGLLALGTVGTASFLKRKQQIASAKA